MDINDLCGIKNITKKVQSIKGFIVEYSTIKPKDEKELEGCLTDKNNKYSFNNFIIETLSYSIISINNKTFHDRSDLKTFLLTLQKNVIDILFSDYLQFEKEQCGDFDNIQQNLSKRQNRLFWKFCKIFKIRPSEISKIPKSELMWAYLQINEDEKEMIEIIQNVTEQLIAAINPELYQKIQRKKNEEKHESSDFQEELKRLGVSIDDYRTIDKQDTPQNYDEGYDIIGSPIKV